MAFTALNWAPAFLARMLTGQGALQGVDLLLALDRKETAKALWHNCLFNKSHRSHTPFFVFADDLADVVTQFHRMGQVRSALTHCEKVF